MLTSKDDLSLASIKQLIDDPLEFEPKDVQEPYTQYVRHFIYMVKRNERSGNDPLGYGKDADGSLSSPKKKARKKTAEREEKGKQESQSSVESNEINDVDSQEIKSESLVGRSRPAKKKLTAPKKASAKKKAPKKKAK